MRDKIRKRVRAKKIHDGRRKAHDAWLIRVQHELAEEIREERRSVNQRKRKGD